MKALLSFFILLLLSSCGESPILNHKNEKSHPVTRALPLSKGPNFPKAKLGFSIEWTKGPQLGVSEFELKMWDLKSGTDQGPFADAAGELSVYLWMPMMGHGSAPVEITKNDRGDYTIKSVVFIMPGTWQIHFQIKKDDKIYDKAVVTYDL